MVGLTSLHNKYELKLLLPVTGYTACGAPISFYFPKRTWGSTGLHRLLSFQSAANGLLHKDRGGCKIDVIVLPPNILLSRLIYI
jgi:hypothetical protein